MLRLRREQRRKGRNKFPAIRMTHASDLDEKRRIRLEPANANMKPIYVKHAKILGVVIGVVRKVT